MKTVLTLLALAGLTLAATALTSAKAPAAAAAPAATTYQIDAVHSTVLFRCKHLGTSWAYGRFDEIAGSFVLDTEKPEASKVSVEIQTASVNTGNGKRDDHLRSPDFLDVKQFPVAKFESTSAKRSGETEWEIQGKLSLHGVTKEVTLRMEFVGSIDDERMGKRSGFHGTLTLQRSAYGIDYMPSGLGEDVHLILSVEGVAQ